MHGFSLQSPLPAPTILIVNHLRELHYGLPTFADGAAWAGGVAALEPAAANRTFERLLLSADPLLSSIGLDEPGDDPLGELRESSLIIDPRRLPADSRYRQVSPAAAEH